MKSLEKRKARNWELEEESEVIARRI